MPQERDEEEEAEEEEEDGDETTNNNNTSSCLVQLGQFSVNPPRLVLEVGGDFNLAGSHAWRAEVPPTSSTSLRGSR